MRSRTLLLGMALAASLLAGCSKHSAQESGTPKLVDLGTVELSPGQPSRHDLGGGAVCVLTAQPLGAGTLELFAVLEKSGRQVATTRRAPTQADVPLDIAFGEIHVGLTPHMK
jgi:hypothetical protein